MAQSDEAAQHYSKGSQRGQVNSDVSANLAKMDLTAATDCTELLKALVAVGEDNTASGIVMDADEDSIYLATDDGVNGYLCLITESDDEGAVAVAADIVLVATFTGDADFADIAAAQTVMVA